MAYSSTESDVKASTSRLGNDLSKAASDAGDRVNDAMSDVKSAASANISNLESAIRKNPLAAAGIAGGVGFLLAVVARR
jgi:ElaB/YqjD/DUF883 family membrane-anchored ribosome-binding protein